jgi:urease alpha subunit
MLLGDLPKKLQRDRRLAGECHNQANPQIAIDPRTAEIRIDGQPLPPLPTEDVPLNRRYFLL